MRQFLSLLLLFVATDVFGQEFSMPVALDVGSQAQSRSPEVHSTRGKVYVAYFEGVLNIRFRRSTDGGISFGTPSLVVEGLSSNHYNMMLQRAPKFVVDPSGLIHLTWTEDRHMMQGDVWYVRSTDDGSTWTQPVSLSGSGDSMKYAQDFASIASDSSGNLYVSFLDFRDRVRGLSDYTQLYLTKSTDKGLTWSEPKRISYYTSGDGGTCECCKQEIAASKEGKVYVAYRSNIDNIRNIYMVRSLDQGSTWKTAERVQDGDWELMACPTQGPNVALDPDGNLHMTWRDARNKDGNPIGNRVFYDVFDDGTETSFPDREVTPINENGSWPAITMVEEASGMWYPEIYYQSSGMNGAIKVRRFNGASFTPAESIVDRNSSSELVSVTVDQSNRVHAVWQESETGSTDKGDIYYSRSSIAAGVSPAGSLEYFIGVKNNVLKFDHQTNRSYEFTIYDILGRSTMRGTISSDQEIALNVLPAGFYMIKLNSDGLESISKFTIR